MYRTRISRTCAYRPSVQVCNSVTLGRGLVMDKHDAGNRDRGRPGKGLRLAIACNGPSHSSRCSDAVSWLLCQARSNCFAPLCRVFACLAYSCQNQGAATVGEQATERMVLEDRQRGRCETRASHAFALRLWEILQDISSANRSDSHPTRFLDFGSFERLRVC